MAKGARASSRKRNNAALRATIFGPANDARTQRLSAKLQELVSKPRAVEEKKIMQVTDNTMAEEKEEDDDEQASGTKDVDIVEDDEGNEVDDEMDVDAQKIGSKSNRKYRKSKVQKKRAHRKAKNSMVFPSITRKRSAGPGVYKVKKR